MKNVFCKLLAPRNSNSKIDDTALLVLRLFVGLTMAFAHGLGKLPPSEMLIGGVSALGFPAPELFAWLAGLAEFVGGVLLALGFLTRPAAFFVAFTMLVAAFGTHGADPFAQKEMSLLYLFLSVFFGVFGAGGYSIDQILSKRK